MTKTGMTETETPRPHATDAHGETNPQPPQRSRPLRVGVVVGSTRPGRKAGAVASWVLELGRHHLEVTSGRADLEVIDLAEVGLPLLDEPVPAVFGIYQHEHTRRWSTIVAGVDAFIFVVPEYNHSIPAVVKNAIDYLYAEWAHKPVGFVGYGLAGGVRAVEHLRLVLSEVKAVPTGDQVALSVFDDFTYADPTDPTEPGQVTPREHQSATLSEMLDSCLALAGALAPLRTEAAGT